MPIHKVLISRVSVSGQVWWYDGSLPFRSVLQALAAFTTGNGRSFLGGKRVKDVAFRFLHLYTYMYKNKYLKAWWLEK